MKMRHLPNVITALRILFTPLLFMLIVSGEYSLALACLVVMGISDGVDGFLAKTYKWCSTLGEQLDPLADKLMLVFAFVALAIVGLVPIWFVVLVAGRDVLLVLGSVARLLLSGRLSVQPVWMSKVSTFLQIVLAFCALAQPIWSIFGEVTLGLTYITAATVVISGAIYLWQFVADGWSGRLVKAVGGYRSLQRTQNN